MAMPLVTAIIPSYNYARYLPEAITSILNQSYPNWELVIVDDASSDGSQEIIREFATRCPERIVPIFLEKNGGQAPATRIAFEHARGELVTFLAADDIARPDRMDQAASFLRERPEVGVVFSKVECIDASSNPLPGTDIERLFNRPAGDLRIELLSGNFLCSTSCVARTEAIRAAGPWNSALRYVEDYEMWMRILAKHEIARVDDVWVSYRVHDRNLSSFQLPKRRVTLENLAVIIRALRQWPLDKLFRFDAVPGSAAHNTEQAAALAGLAERCLNLDKQYLGRPMLGTSHAYMLAMDALLIDPQCAPARKVLDSSLEYMEAFLPGG